MLVVEDDRQLGPLLVELLTEAGYQVDLARDGQAGLHHALTRDYDVMIIDRMLPAIEGVDLVRRLRSKGVTTPIMILSARGALADRVEGLDAGSEEYLVKPFEIEELLARLRALRRRHLDNNNVMLRLGSRHLDITERRVVGDGRAPVELSGRECELLRILAVRPGRVVSRDELLASVFEGAEAPGIVDTYVHYLRRKLGRGVIKTVHGLGYRLGEA
jgi:two-component system response regulator QseB